MSKNQANQATKTVTHDPQKQAVKTGTGGPANYKPIVEDRFEVSGFWLPEAGAIHGVLVGGYELIQKSGRNKGKTSRVLVFKLLDPCMARVKLEGGGFDEVELARGELCGVFYSAGLREVLGYAGCKVFLKRNPESMKKETTRGAMWTFDKRFEGTKRPLAIRPPFEPAAKGEEDASFNPDDFGAEAF